MNKINDFFKEKEKQLVDLNGQTILVTGCAGFIGSNLTIRLLRELSGATIVGVDCLTNYNPIALKQWRLAQIKKEQESSFSNWVWIKGDISDVAFVQKLFKEYSFSIVVNLAAQAGVRYSIDFPDAYIKSNIIGFYNLLEACRIDDNLQHLVYASSSSVYGGNKKLPFSIEDSVDHPVSLYAVTKKTDELMAHAYSNLYNIPSTGLRFFTVYGPAGRTDMFYFSATNNLRKGGKIQIFNYGNCMRDFTYIDDIVEGVFRVMQGAPKSEMGSDGFLIPPYDIYNIGGGKPENLFTYVSVLQEELVAAGVLPKNFDFEAHMELVEMQQGDLPITYADTTALERDYGFCPHIGIREGLRNFAEWYRDFYLLNKTNI